MVVETSQPSAFAQTNISGDIAGRVTDPSGAVVQGATVKVVDVTNGSTRTTTTNSAGDYRVPLLPPDHYTVTVTAPGFQATEQTVALGIGTVNQVNIQLTVGKSAQTVMVSASTVPLLHTDDAQIATTFSMEQVQTLPNPGNDLTFIAQTAPGSVMSTQSEYGNFSSFGLPAVANTFTVNGGYENDPFLNLSNSGATNLLLGNNDIANVTVTSNAYSAVFGGLGGAQVSETSRSGGNAFHGNATYWWNGSSMNANDYFNNQTGTKRPFSNVNQWAAAIGGPIKRNKTFFFYNFEGLRIVLPTRSTVYAPDAMYEANTLANLTANGLSAETPVYQNIFNLYNHAPGYSTATQSTSDTAQVGPLIVDPTSTQLCSISNGQLTVDPNGTIKCSNATGYGTVVFNGSAGNFTHEWLMTGRIDQNLSDRDELFGHAKIDKGLQASYTNVLNPVFNADSPQPQYEGQLGETHTFSPNLTNQFLFAAIYYRAIFTNTSLDAATALVPFSLIFADQDLGNNTPPAWPGGYDLIWPQGRNVTGYQFQDDVNWTTGKHSISFGWTMRRDDVTDYSPSEYTASPEAVATNNSFEEGYSDEWFEQFPTRSTQPVALYTMGWYLQDQWKALPNLTITAGLRFEHNSNPVCQTDCFARLSGNFSNVSNDPATAYNQMIVYDQHQALHHLQALEYEPRVGFAWLPGGADSHTTVRGGFGMFADAFPGQIADSFLNNAPGNVPFTIYGPAFGGGLTALGPAAPNSAYSIASSSYAAFNSGFANGGSLSTISAAVPAFSAPGIVNADQKISYPTYVEYSLSLERQVNRATALSLQYVGNFSYHQPVLNNSVNTFNGGSAPGFPELSTTDAPNDNFGAVTEVSSIARSNYNGMVASVTHRSGDLTLQFNYAYSHALDEISNGGFDPFSANSQSPDNPFDLRSDYGNADYDTRNYISASYVYSLRHYWGPNVLTGGWQVSGTFFHNSGFPFSVVDTGTATSLVNYGGPLYAEQTAPLSGNHCGGANNSLFGAAHPCSFAGDYTTATNFAQSRRNQIYGPSYTDTDMAVLKSFNMPHWESGKLIIGAQFFNLFNHPNFGQPGNDVATPSTLGLVSSTVNTPTSILGSFLGGDASPRLIQLKASFVF
ncbi:MAG: carboxypeptidase regulatory-like domain-containing protein [Acidobacteriaceae bacterium]